MEIKPGTEFQANYEGCAQTWVVRHETVDAAFWVCAITGDPQHNSYVGILGKFTESSIQALLIQTALSKRGLKESNDASYELRVEIPCSSLKEAQHREHQVKDIFRTYDITITHAAIVKGTRT